ncbi:helix-turn-helix domain-containing protein [Nonomuraea sp. NPDC055795]
MRALVATITQDQDRPLGERDRLALAAGLDHARRRLPPRTTIHLERPDHGILILVQPVPAMAEIDDLAAALHQRLAAESGRTPRECWIGIGEHQPGLSGAYRSYAEARQGADVARTIRVLGPVVSHSELGVYGLLAELPADRLGHSLHPGLRRLLGHDAGHEALVTTLETFLDHAGDIKRTAASLCIHRASLYYRLRRIEEIASVDLSSGDDRLTLHLGLKIARLTSLR